jgi:hypothetical protein
MPQRAFVPESQRVETDQRRVIRADHAALSSQQPATLIDQRWSGVSHQSLRQRSRSGALQQVAESLICAVHNGVHLQSEDVALQLQLWLSSGSLVANRTVPEGEAAVAVAMFAVELEKWRRRRRVGE